MIFFVGILDGKNDVWGVRVPDVPGCNGGGATPEAAIQDAISALYAMAGEASDVKPRNPTELASDPHCEFNPSAGENFVMLPFLAARGVF